MTTFFTADTHFNHANLMKYEPVTRGCFRDVDHMNEALVQRWCERVGPDDTVYHLGDFGMGQKEKWAGFRQRLNGRIVLIRGNHDRGADFMRDVVGMDEVYDSLDLPGQRVHLSHKPERGPLHPAPNFRLCGHVHGLWARQGEMINVGCDVSNLTPLTFEELLARDPEDQYRKCYVCGEELQGFTCPDAERHGFGGEY